MSSSAGANIVYRNSAFQDPNHPAYQVNILLEKTENVSDADASRRNNLEKTQDATVNRGKQIEIPKGCDPAGYLSDLGREFAQKYDKTGAIKHLEQAISYCEEAMARVSLDSPYRPIILDSFARRLLSRFEATNRAGKMEDLERAISLGRQSLEITPRNDPYRPTLLNGLSARFEVKFKTNSDLYDLNEAISLAREAVKLTPKNSGDHLACRQGNLASRLNLMYEFTRDLSYLDEAVELSRQAVYQTPPTHYRAGRLCNLGNRLDSMYQRMGDLKHLDEAILWRKQALREVPMGHIDRCNILNSLAVSLRQKYERTGDLSELEQAISLSQQSVDKTSINSPDWPMRVNNLCNRLMEKYQRNGSLDHLQSAISKAEDALSMTPKDSNAINRVMILNTLTVTLELRYRRSGAMSDLDLAALRSKQAVEEVPLEHYLRFGIFHTRSGILALKYYRMRTLNDLEQAILYEQKAVDETPSNHPERTIFLSNLGILFGDRYLHLKATEDLEKAIFYSQGALDAAPPDSSRAAFLTNLGNWLSARFETKKDKGDLDKAILCAEEACKLVEKTPEDPDRANVMLCLASKLQRRHKLTKDPMDYDLVVRYLSESMRLVSSPPHTRIDCALTLANIHLQHARWADVNQVTEYAINLLPLLSSRSLVQKDQQHSLRTYAGLASRAAAASLQAEKPAADALRLLELGRGIIANHRFETRSDISELEREHPKVAQEYRRLCDELDSPKNTFGEYTESTTASDFSRRQEAEIRLDKLLVEIRQQPNFEDFLLTLDPSKFLATEPSGTIVVINVSFRCDAFIVRKDHTTSLPLPNLHESEVHEKASLLKSGKLPMDDMLDMLKWLWDVVAGPVLEQLRITKAPEDDNWPRIWWIPTGSFSNLPIHAAGYHLDNSGRTVLDRAISSYSPSIRSLVFAFQNKSPRRQVPSQDKVVFASMENTPEMNTLPYVTMEIDQLQQLLPKSIPSVRLNTPQRIEVLNELIGCNVFHFAGHGISDPSDPSKSCLAVADKPLTVEDLIDQKLHQNPPLLAYLSACSTGNNQVDDLIDEGIHLMGACQLAGFQHVIGSLWEVSDIHCVEVAKCVYTTMINNGMSAKSVSLGLHNAARALRGESARIKQVGQARKAVLIGSRKGEALRLKDPRYWAAYIHMGI